MPTITVCQALEPGITDAQIAERITELTTLGGALDAYVQLDGPTRYLYTVREVTEGPPEPAQAPMEALTNYLQVALTYAQENLRVQQATHQRLSTEYYEGRVQMLNEVLRWLAAHPAPASRPSR